MRKIIEIDGKPVFDTGYYDGSNVYKAIKPEYTPSLIEQRKGVDLAIVAANTKT